MMRRAARKLCDSPISPWRLERLARSTFQASEGTSLLARGLLKEHRSDHVQTFGCNAHNNRDHMQMSWTTFCLAFGSALAIGSGGLSETAMNEAGPRVNESNSGVDSGSVSDEIIDPEKVMEQVETGIQNRLKTLNISSSILPTYTITAKGQQTSVKFPISPLCDLWGLIVDVISQMGKLNSGLTDGKMKVSASESPVAQVLTLEQLHEKFRTDIHKDAEINLGSSSGPLRIWVFEPLIGEKFPEIEFSKKGFYSEEELDLVVSTLRLAVTEKSRDTPRDRYKRAHERKKNGGDDKAVSALEAMGVKVYGKDSLTGSIDREAISWDNIAGYNDQKREIEDSVLLALQCPEVYDNIARGTRRKFESNRPRAILFEGPPGTGKTSSARVIANQAGVPMLYVPLEAVVSKYYGESERILGKVFDNANKFPNGSIIFLDEIDSLAMTRDSEMHEATRRMLSVLLRQIDGFEQDSRVVVIAATNRKEDLDPALISRFNSSITFDLPDKKTREEITAQYARHLTPSELAAVAEASEGMSGRDLQNICQQAERHWASKLIRNKGESSMTYSLPPIQEYLECAEKRRISNHMLSLKNGSQGRSGHYPRTHPSWPPSVVV